MKLSKSVPFTLLVSINVMWLIALLGGLSGNKFSPKNRIESALCYIGTCPLNYFGYWLTEELK